MGVPEFAININVLLTFLQRSAHDALIAVDSDTDTQRRRTVTLLSVAKIFHECLSRPHDLSRQSTLISRDIHGDQPR